MVCSVARYGALLFVCLFVCLFFCLFVFCLFVRKRYTQTVARTDGSPCLTAQRDVRSPYDIGFGNGRQQPQPERRPDLYLQ